MSKIDRQFIADGVKWYVGRQVPIRIGSSQAGFLPGSVPSSGLRFIAADTSECRFLPMAYPDELPSQQEFEALSDRQLAALLARAAAVPS